MFVFDTPYRRWYRYKIGVTTKVAYQNRLRRDNLSRIFEALWHTPGLSRAELARQLRLDRSTTGQLADSLVELGALEQHQDEESGPRGGRPPVRLRIRPGYGVAVGVELTFPHIRLVAMDIDGTMVEYREVPIKRSVAESVETLVDAVTRLAQSVEYTTPTTHGLMAIGVGASAVVDAQRGVIVRSDAISMDRPLEIASLVPPALSVPIRVLNDAQACALGEIHEHSDGDLLLALIEFRPGDALEDIGVGFALVVDGDLRHGRAVTHLLRPAAGDRPWNKERFMEDVGRSLAVVANTAGVNRIILAGDAEEVFQGIEDSIYRHADGPDKHHPSGIVVGRTSHGVRSVAIGACHAAVDNLFRTHRFPTRVKRGEHAPGTQEDDTDQGEFPANT